MSNFTSFQAPTAEFRPKRRSSNGLHPGEEDVDRWTLQN